jgi:hypothetical protein
VRQAHIRTEPGSNLLDSGGVPTFEASSSTRYPDSQFADRPARAYFLRVCADGRPAFLRANGLVKNLPNQTTEPVGDCIHGLAVLETQDEPAIDDGEIVPLAFPERFAAFLRLD